MKLNKFLLFLVAAVFAIVLAACGGSEDEAAEGSAADEDGSSEELEGNVEIDGSGTVYPLMSRLAEEYMLTEQEGVSVEVSRAGTSAGFERFLAEDGTNFNDASREISEEEEATAEELGIDIMELKLALDGLTIVVHPENDFAAELTEEQVQDIFLGEYTTWSEIDSDWPDEEINTYGPNENHGTYEFFYEEILEEQDLVDSINLQQEYSTLVTLIAEDENAIGFFGFGYYDSNQDQVQAVSIDFGDGAVEPSLDTIAEEGPYENFTRPVFTYLNTNHAQEAPEVFDYATYILESTNDFAGETGFAPIPDEEVEEQLEELNALQSE